MNNAQRIALAVIVANLILISLFPPYNYISLQHGNIPTFDGFYFAFSAHQNRILNGDFFALEIIVVMINACIALLLLRTPPLREPPKQPGGNRRQRIMLMLVAINLVLVLMFPPFEFFSAITKAALPTFEGFYFILADHSQRQLVTPILYIEVSLIIINGALLWLLFRDKPTEASTEELRDLAQRIRAARKK